MSQSKAGSAPVQQGVPTPFTYFINMVNGASFQVELPLPLLDLMCLATGHRTERLNFWESLNSTHTFLANSFAHTYGFRAAGIFGIGGLLLDVDKIIMAVPNCTITECLPIVYEVLGTAQEDRSFMPSVLVLDMGKNTLSVPTAGPVDQRDPISDVVPDTRLVDINGVLLNMDRFSALQISNNAGQLFTQSVAAMRQNITAGKGQTQ